MVLAPATLTRLRKGASRSQEETCKREEQTRDEQQRGQLLTDDTRDSRGLSHLPVLNLLFLRLRILRRSSPYFHLEKRTNTIDSIPFPPLLRAKGKTPTSLRARD